MPYHAALCQPGNPSAGGTGKHTLDKDVCAGRNTEAGHELALLRARRYTEARTGLEQALAAAEQRKSIESADVACLMSALGFVEIQLFRPDEAAAWYERAQQLAPLPDELRATLTYSLAQAYVDSQQFDRAEKTARLAVALSEQAFGRDSPELLFPQVLLASFYARRGEHAVVEPVLRRALYLSERAWGASSYEVAQAANNLAVVYLAQGRPELARELFGKALAALQENVLATKEEIVVVQASLAESCAAGGRHREAEVHVQQALASAKDISPEHTLLPIILQRAAIALFHLKQYEPAWQFLDRAIVLLEARHGPGSPPVLASLERYVALARAAKDRVRAKQIDARRKALIAKG